VSILTIVIRRQFFKQKFKRTLQQNPNARKLVEDVEAMQVCDGTKVLFCS
jgi:hypothetical protein